MQSIDMVLSNGVVLDNFLHVNKNRLNMECMGALIALGDKAKNLDRKVEKIEEAINSPKNAKMSPLKKKNLNFTCFKILITIMLLIIFVGYRIQMKIYF